MAEIADAILREAERAGGQLPCVRAFQLARRLGVSPAEVGAAADAAGVHVSRCQLGLFGYGPKAEGKSKIVRTMNPVPATLAEKLQAAVDPTGRLACSAVWDVARQARISRLDAAGAVEGLGLRVTECQLGCFKPGPRAH